MKNGLPVSKEISQHNPELEVIFTWDDDNQPGYYLKCALIPEVRDTNTDQCQQIEGLEIRSKFINYGIVFYEFLPHFPIPCTDCPVFRQHTPQPSPASIPKSTP